MKQSVTSGLTLIELMITLLIASIALTAALPQIGSISSHIKFNGVQQNLVHSLVFTRSEAIKRGLPVTICASTDEATCSAIQDDWSDGWMIYADKNNSGAYESADDDFIRAQRIDSVADITFEPVVPGSPVNFLSDGTVTSTGSFKICNPHDSTMEKGVKINLSGRARSTDSVTCP